MCVAPADHRSPRVLGDGLEDLVEQSAAPASVRAALSRMLEAQPALADRLSNDEPLARATVAVLGASRWLTRVMEVHNNEALDVLGALELRVALDASNPEELAGWRQLEVLRIAARDLTGLDRLEATGAALSSMAGDVLQAAWGWATGQAGPGDGSGPASHGAVGGALAVIGMGKLAGNELNYSSDVDIVLVGEGDISELEAAARRIVEISGACFRVDTALRPEGRDGSLVRSVGSYAAYWDRWAQPWEFQALLKARPVAGDAELGREWLAQAQQRLWSRPVSADDLRALRDMKRRAEAEVTRRGLAGRELKRGPGGIRDIEFTLQLLQLVHGPADAELRSATTLSVLKEMAEAGYVDPADAEQLEAAYRFFRDVEHRLQLMDDQQVHTLPTDTASLDRLGRVAGFRDRPEGSAAEQLVGEVARHQRTVRSIHERVYFRPLLEAFSGAPGGLSPEAAAARLAAFGFTETMRTQAAVRELTRGLNRSSRLMQQLLPLLLDWLSDSPDPDLGLLMLRNLLGEGDRARAVTTAFRDSASAAQNLCTLLGTSRMLGDTLLRNPDLTPRLGDADQLRTRSRPDLVDSAGSTVSWRPEAADRREALQRWKARHLFGIAARDVLGEATVEVIGRDLTALAEAALEVALANLHPQVPMAVIGMGRLGGAELSYASDLDLIFVHEGDGDGANEEAKRVAGELLRFLGGPTPAERIFDVDADLRPEGRQGPLSRSVEGYAAYWERYAQTWERQAMVRARPVAGDAELAGRFLAELEPYVWGAPLGQKETIEIRRMKARIESERIPAGEDPQFHLKLGRGSLSDVEFTAQLLQLTHGVRATGTMEALGALEAAGVVGEADASALASSYRFCEQVRDRRFLVVSAPGDSLPTQPEALGWLARSLGTTAGELREEYRRVTRRARRVVERLFYDRT